MRSNRMAKDIDITKHLETDIGVPIKSFGISVP